MNITGTGVRGEWSLDNCICVLINGGLMAERIFIAVVLLEEVSCRSLPGGTQLVFLPFFLTLSAACLSQGIGIALPHPPEARMFSGILAPQQWRELTVE